MNKAFEKIIEKLEEYKYLYLVERDSEQSQHCNDVVDCELKDCSLCVFDKAIEIVKQEAEQYTSNEHINCSSDETELLIDLLTAADMQAGGQDA